MERSSCRSVLVLRWKVDSVCLEGEAGDIGGLNLAGDDDGVEGPRNDASRLMSREHSIVGCLCLIPTSEPNSFQK